MFTLSQVVNTSARAAHVQDRYVLTNLAPYGNFDSADGWSALGGNISTTDNALVVTDDTTHDYFYVYYDTDIPMAGLEGKRVVLKVKMTPVGDIQCSSVRAILRGTVAGTATLSTIVSYPTLGEEVEVTINDTIDSTHGTGYLRIYLYETFTGTKDLTGDQMEARELLLFNATDIFKRGNEPDTDDLDEMLAGLNCTWFADEAYIDRRVNKNQVDALITSLDTLNDTASDIHLILPRKYHIDNMQSRAVYAVWREWMLSYFGGHMYSEDAGETWTACEGIETAPETPDTSVLVGIIFRSGKAVVFGDDAYYYADLASVGDRSFTRVTYAASGIQAAPYYSGISLLPGTTNDTAIFGEYLDSVTGHCRLWKTADGGATWSESLDVTSNIRHFHTVAYCMHDTYGGMIATSGDADADTHWWLSQNSGTSWTKIVDGSSVENVNPQSYRTLGQVFDQDGNVWWCSDAGGNDMTSIYKASLATPYTKTTVATLTGIGYGLRQSGGTFVAVTACGYYQPVTASYIYCSTDSGATWDIVRKDALATRGILAMMRLFGPDYNGRFFVPHLVMEEYTSGTYRMDIRNQHTIDSITYA